MSALTSKKKMNVITKSRLDWDSFKKTEDLEEELAYSTKDGYVCGCVRLFVCVKGREREGGRERDRERRGETYRL